MKTGLDVLIRVMFERQGRDISHYDESFLQKSIERRARATGSVNTESYLERLDLDCIEAETLASSLTVSYSEFFRNSLTFALLEHLVLPALAAAKAGRTEIRIWSAGCAAGQEAYSVAILLDELATVHKKPIPYRIFATDQSETELAAARTGIYGQRAVGKVRVEHLGAYFAQRGDGYTISARLRERIDWSTYDLLDELTAGPPASIYNGFDLIICSNVLIYYRPEICRDILKKMRDALLPGGYFVTDTTERGIVESTDWFRSVAPIAAVYQRVS